MIKCTKLIILYPSGPILFLMYINYLGKNICSTVLKFADDTKLAAKVDSSEAVNSLRRVLCSLAAWSEGWIMLFNIDRCSVMHFEYNNKKEKYVLGGRQLKELTTLYCYSICCCSCWTHPFPSQSALAPSWSAKISRFVTWGSTPSLYLNCSVSSHLCTSVLCGAVV